MKEYEILNGGYQAQYTKFSRGSGCYLYDENNVEYIDMVMGAGSLILGHANEQVVNAIQEQSQHGSIFLQNNDKVQQLSQSIAEKIPEHLTKYIYCNSGSEATQRAVRIARAATNKSVIASFQGGWHGMNEWTLLDDGGRFGATNQSLPTRGIPDGALKETLSLPYNSENTFTLLRKHADVIAAVIIEPLQGSNPQPEIKYYLQKLEETCTDLNIILIFDEIITGFRINSGGGANYFSIKPDIATYGKILGGGLPIGMVAISDDIHHKTFLDPNKSMLTGGTFSANPLSAAAGNAAIIQLDEHSYKKLDGLGALFRQLANEKFVHFNIPFKADGLGSISRIYFTDQPFKNREERDQLEIKNSLQSQFKTKLWEKKIIWPTNGIICNALCQTNELIQHVVEQVVDTAINIIELPR